MMIPRPPRVLVVAAAVLVASACGQERSPSEKSGFPSIRPLPTLVQVYGQAQQTLRTRGVYHEKITLIQDAGEFSVLAHVERWTDAAHGRAREQALVSGKAVDESAGKPKLITRLLVGEELWQGPDEIVAAPGCHGADAATGGVLGCPDPTQAAAKTTVAWSTSGGTSVLTLSTKVHGESEDSTSETTDVVTLDATTMLPLSSRSDGTLNDQPFHARQSVVGSFIDRLALAKGFFDPASLGWKKTEPLASIPAQAKVYWLGSSWNPGAGLPDLVLSATEPAEDPGYDAILDYALASDRYGSPAVITIQLWRRAVWDGQHIDITADRCAAKPVKVLAGSATLYCPEPGQVSAFVTLPDAVLMVDAAAAQEGDTVIANPFGTVAAMTTVLRTLRAK